MVFYHVIDSGVSRIDKVGLFGGSINVGQRLEVYARSSFTLLTTTPAIYGTL